MNDLVKDLLDKVVPRKRQLVVQSEDVLEVLDIINLYKSYFINTDLNVDKIKFINDIRRYVSFKASNIQWSAIVSDLRGKGFELVIKNQTEYIFVTRK